MSGMWMTGLRRVERSRAQARRAYDRLSRWYDMVEEPFERRARRRGLAVLAARPGERVLELGPGTGQALVALATAVGPDGHVDGLDLSPGMVRQAQARVDRAGVGDRVSLAVGDAAESPYPDGGFDAVFASFVLELFDTPEIPRVLAECRRVLRPGGRMVVVAMARPDPPGIAVSLYEWSHDRFPATLDCRPIRAAGAMAAADLTIRGRARVSLFGLPVDVVVAERPG